MVTFTILSGSTTIGTAQTRTSPRAAPAPPIRCPPARRSAPTPSRPCTTATTDFVGSSDSTHTLTRHRTAGHQAGHPDRAPSTATAGQAFATTSRPIVVYEEDQFGDLESGDNTTVVDGHARQRERPAGGDAHRDRSGRRGHVHRPGRQHGRDHHSQVLERQPDARHVLEHHRQPGSGQQAGRDAGAVAERDGRTSSSHPAGRGGRGPVRQRHQRQHDTVTAARGTWGRPLCWVRTC